MTYQDKIYEKLKQVRKPAPPKEGDYKQEAQLIQQNIETNESEYIVHYDNLQMVHEDQHPQQMQYHKFPSGSQDQVP